MTTAIDTKTVRITDASFKAEVLESDRPVLVDFWAPWCGPCRLLGPTIEELAGEYEGSVKVGKLNVDENPAAAGTYGIQSIPAVLLFKAGEVVQTIVGAQPKQHYEHALEQVQETATINTLESKSTVRTLLCPHCDRQGKSVKPITLRSLVKEELRDRITEGPYRYCESPECDTVYYAEDGSHTFLKSDLTVRVGIKETAPPRHVCYCFDHTVEEIEDEVRRTGTSRIPDEITQKCRQGLDRCEVTNPQGRCCLGNVRRAVKEAQAELGKKECNIHSQDCCAVDSGAGGQENSKTETLICPTCGCSLVRLGIRGDQAAVLHHNGEEYRFCCQECAEVFTTDPQRYLQETEDLIVCPTCLAEKPLRSAVKVKHSGRDVYFCRCPYCVEVFQKDPAYYIKRLEGAIPFEGVMDHEGCCVRP